MHLYPIDGARKELTALADRTWVWSLAWAGAILVVGILVPRGFCGYVCPLGTRNNFV